MFIQLSSLQSLSCVQLFVTPWTAAHQASLSFTNAQFTQTHVHWVTDAIQTSHPLSSPSPPAFNLSQQQGLFKLVSSLHQVAKVWSFSFSISPSNVYSVLISWMHFVCVYIYIHIHCCWLFTTVYHLPQLLVSHVHLICDPMGCSLLGSSVLGISQARILEWVAIAFSRGFSQPKDQTWVSCIGRWVRNHWATREPHA